MSTRDLNYCYQCRTYHWAGDPHYSEFQVYSDSWAPITVRPEEEGRRICASDFEHAARLYGEQTASEGDGLPGEVLVCDKNDVCKLFSLESEWTVNATEVT